MHGGPLPTSQECDGIVHTTCSGDGQSES